VVVSCDRGGCRRRSEIAWHDATPARILPPRHNRTGANGNIANHCGGELVRGVGGSLSPGTVQLGTVHLRVRFRYFSLFRVLTSHSTMATLQLLRIESAPLPFTAPWAWPPAPLALPIPFPIRVPSSV
jgi:hypothetical protein